MNSASIDWSLFHDASAAAPSHRSRKGFTMFEVLLVVVALGLLAALVIPTVDRFFDATGDTAKTHNAQTMNQYMETIAQRQLALVTDNAITPQPDRLVASSGAFRVQRVTLRASGKDLAALLTWLGKVEETYPAAMVEACEFTSNVGGSTGLTVRIVQPLVEPGAHRLIGDLELQEVAQFPEVISSISWTKYLPARVKSAVAVGLQRNPLQPAVIADQRPISVVRDEADEVSPRVESALQGRVRSVIRGTAPIVVIDGRVFRIGDEVVIGKHRERVMPAVKTRLKHIGDDHLVLQVSGGTADRPIICEVAYELPAFLKAR